MTTPPKLHSATSLPLILALSLLAGCDRDTPTGSRVNTDDPGDRPNAIVQNAQIGPGADNVTPPPPPDSPTNPNYTGDGISWTLPHGWSQQPASGMRYATLVPPAGGPEVSVTRLGGGGGGTLANINRWRGQVFLPPITEADLDTHTTKVDLAGVTALRVDIVGPQGRILGALIPGRSGQTWFLKAQTPTPDAMNSLLPDFDTLLASLRAAQ